jgi:outer membrane protein OmpU
MKKLLCSAAVVGLAFAATPAHAASDGLKVDLGGFFKGYGFYTDQDDEDVGAASNDSREFDIIRSTEVHVGGETTLDNGLTVGVHLEMEADDPGGDDNDSFDVQESYAYFSGGWGRVNFGAEDGAAYLLQVEAPSADANLDGIRQYVNPVNFGAAQVGAGAGQSLAALNVNGSDGIDYDQDVSGYADKLTYLSPIMNGFQLGASYTPDLANESNEDALNFDDVEDAFGAVYDIAARYEGQFNNVGVIVGAGYTHAELEEEVPVDAVGDFGDDREAWNAGIDLDIGPFGVGVAYMADNFGDTDTVAGAVDTEMDEEETWVVGADYTTGPFKLGLSYLNKEAAASIIGPAADATDGVEAERWTGGVVYTYGPGMTFRGSVSHLSLDNVDDITDDDSADATSVLLGTQINF